MAYLPGQSTFEMSITSGKFEADMFVMANARNFNKLGASDEYLMPCTETVKLASTGDNQYKSCELTHNPVADSISVVCNDRDLSNPDGKFDPKASGSPSTGEVVVTAASGNTKATLKFLASDVATAEKDQIIVSYFYNLMEDKAIDEDSEVQESLIDNRSSAIGEAVMVYPVYGSGDDCSDSAIIGNVIVKVFRARVTAAPGFDASLATLRDAA